MVTLTTGIRWEQLSDFRYGRGLQNSDNYGSGIQYKDEMVVLGQELVGKV